MVTKSAKRKRIGCGEQVRVDALSPLKDCAKLIGIRVYDVGQGDALAVIDEHGDAVLQIDYGGREGSPFSEMEPDEVDAAMPIPSGALVMLTHWDEDHWCSAGKASAVKQAHWIVPRQVTSPRAVRFSAKLPNARCIPEEDVGRVFEFRAANGDALFWEKIAHSASADGREENCNRTGVALALVRAGDPGEVILIPGDAAFHTVPFYRALRQAGLTLTGVVAFHHGSKEHWTRATRTLLKDWPTTNGGRCQIVFSCAEDNSYGHPHPDRYDDVIEPNDMFETKDARANGATFIDILFT